MPAARSIPRQYPDGCAGSRSRVGHLKRRTMDLEPENRATFNADGFFADHRRRGGSIGRNRDKPCSRTEEGGSVTERSSAATEERLKSGHAVGGVSIV